MKLHTLLIEELADKFNLTSERRKDVAEKKLREYQGLVGKKVSMFMEN